MRVNNFLAAVIGGILAACSQQELEAFSAKHGAQAVSSEPPPPSPAERQAHAIIYLAQSQYMRNIGQCQLLQQYRIGSMPHVMMEVQATGREFDASAYTLAAQNEFKSCMSVAQSELNLEKARAATILSSKLK